MEDTERLVTIDAVKPTMPPTVSLLIIISKMLSTSNHAWRTKEPQGLQESSMDTLWGEKMEIKEIHIHICTIFTYLLRAHRSIEAQHKTNSKSLPHSVSASPVNLKAVVLLSMSNNWFVLQTELNNKRWHDFVCKCIINDVPEFDWPPSKASFTWTVE